MRQRTNMLAALILLPVIVTAGENTDVTRHDALVQLRDGNRRHVEGQAGEAIPPERHLLACVVTCSDLSVPVEVIFDQSPGDLYVIRLAGPVMPAEIVASVEYALEQWSVPLVVVLGHTQCETVEDAVVSRADRYTGPAVSILSRLQRAVSTATHKGFSGEEVFTAAVNENARMGAQALLDGSRLIEEAVLADSLIVLAATYDESTGQVKWLTQVSAAAVATQSIPETVTPAAMKARAETQPKAQVADKKANAKKEVKNVPPGSDSEETSSYARRHR